MAQQRPNDEPLTREELILVTREIKAITKRVVHLKKEFQEIKMLAVAPKIAAHLGLKAVLTPIQGLCIQQTDIISRLPNEIGMMIFKNLADADKMCLALTCKQFAGLYENHRNLEIVVQKTSRAITKFHRLEFLIQLGDWMPAKYKLCCACIRYLPKRRKKIIKEDWAGDEKILYRSQSTRKVHELGPRCPYCAQRDRLHKVKARIDAQKLMEMIRDL